MVVSFSNVNEICITRKVPATINFEEDNKIEILVKDILKLAEYEGFKIKNLKFEVENNVGYNSY